MERVRFKRIPVVTQITSNNMCSCNMQCQPKFNTDNIFYIQIFHDMQTSIKFRYIQGPQSLATSLGNSIEPKLFSSECINSQWHKHAYNITHNVWEISYYLKTFLSPVLVYGSLVASGRYQILYIIIYGRVITYPNYLINQDTKVGYH